MSLKFLEQVFLGNRILDYLIALTALVGGLLFVKLVVIAVVRHLKKAAEKTVTMFDDLLVEIIEKIVLPGLYISCFYLGSKVLNLPSAADN